MTILGNTEVVGSNDGGGIRLGEAAEFGTSIALNAL